MSKVNKIIWLTLSILPILIVYETLTLWGISTTYAIQTAIIAWVVIYFYFIGQYFWITVESNHGVVLQNYFKSESGEKDPSKSQETDGKNPNNGSAGDKKSLYIPRGQRAIFSGLNIKLPWEYALEPISLVKETDCGGTISIQGEDKFRYSVTYKIPLTAVRSKYLPRYLMVEEKTASAFFKSVVESEIRKIFAGNNGNDICKDFAKYSAENLARLFGGNETITNDENHYGRFTNTPLITDARIEESGQKAAEIGEIATNLAKAVDTLTQAGMTPDLAAAILQNKDVDIINVSGDPALAAAFAANRGTKKKGGTK